MDTKTNIFVWILRRSLDTNVNSLDTKGIGIL